MRTMEEGNFNRNDLFKKAMNKDWAYVVEAYKNNRLVRRAKLTRTEHTILHLAVLQKDDDVVEQLVNVIEDDEASEILKLQNNLGDTPFHVAAALGLAKICVLFAKKWTELVVIACNNVGENPLYVAVHHGKMEAFFTLLDFVHGLMYTDLSFCRRGDGNTILHAAVHGAYFEIAIVIIQFFPSLVNFNNDMGQTPLHLLANKPLIFKNGNPPVNIFMKLVYSWIKVDKLQSKYQQRYFNYKNRWMTESEIDMERAGLFFKDECRKPVRPTKQRFLEIGYTVLKFLNIVIDVLMVPFRIHILMVSFRIYKAIYFMLFRKIGTTIEIAKREKTMYEHANQVMKKLIALSSYWKYDESGKIYTPDEESSTNSESLGREIMLMERPQEYKNKATDKPIRDSPILVAAKMGIVEMVKNILDTFPEAIEDLDSNHKNIILLSAEHRQQKVYQHILEREPRLASAFGLVDNDGNSALHLAAGATRTNNPNVFIDMAGPALQMHWEIKWYKFVMDSVEPSLFQYFNNKGQTAKDIFLEAHQSLVKEGREWLRNTSQACSVIAALIVTVAFTFSKTVPGGVNQTSGFPTLRGKPAFSVFAQAAAVALFSSIISVLMFLNTLTTHFHEWHFESYVPLMMLIGLITLFASIVSMLISFIASYMLVMEDYKSLPVFVCSCIPIILIMIFLPVHIGMTSVMPSHVPEDFILALGDYL